MYSLVVVVAWVFVLTNVDTLLVLVAFCADDDYRFPEVLVGHYLGFAVGLAAAVFVVYTAAEFLHEWVFLLGIVPLAMGVWGLARQQSDRRPPEPVVATNRSGRIGVVTAAGIGLSGENLAVYIPLFSTFSREELLATIGLYVIGAGLWYLFALSLARRARVVGQPVWFDRWLVPTSLTLVGGYVLLAGWFVA